MMTSTKKCKKCGEDKNLSDFYAKETNSDGFNHQCKECVKARAAKHRQDNLDAIQAYDRDRNRTEKRKALSAAIRPRYKEKATEWGRAWRKRNPEKYAAHNKLNNAVRDGKLIKGACEVCGEPEVEAHHDDYAKPLDVRWLCPKHHGLTRRIDPLGENGDAQAEH